MVSGEPLVGVAKIPYAYESGKEARPVVGFQFIDTQLRGLKFKYRSATVIRYIPE